MENLNERIGKNIRVMRKSIGETQAQLGSAIGVQHNTISEYENGKKQPAIEILQRIASHYSVTLDQLILGSISRPNLINDVVSLDKIVCLINIVLPIVITEGAQKNDYFNDGYKYAQRIMSAIEHGEKPSPEMVFRWAKNAHKAYVAAGKQGLLEATANDLQLSLLVPFAMAMAVPSNLDPQLHRIMQALSENGEKLNEILKVTRTIKDNNESHKIEEGFAEFTAELADWQACSLKKLSMSSEFRDLANYYSILVTAMVWPTTTTLPGSDYSVEMNKVVGFEKMEALALANNAYAERFIESFFGAY